MGQRSGSATRALMRRQYEVFGDKRFERLAGLSNGHLYKPAPVGVLSAPTHGGGQDPGDTQRHRAAAQAPARLCARRYRAPASYWKSLTLELIRPRSVGVLPVTYYTEFEAASCMRMSAPMLPAILDADALTECRARCA